MDKFDYGAPAELFLSKSRGASRRPMKYRKFATGAEAVRYAIEDLSPVVLSGTVLEANEGRFDSTEIRKLYESDEYPLARRM